MKILISDFEGGTANHVRSILERLDASPFGAEVVCSDQRARGAASSVPVTVLSERRRRDRFPFTQSAHLIEIARLLRRRPADVLHTYFFWPIMYGRVLKLLGLVPRLVENREDEGFDWTDREYAMLRATRRVPDRVVCVSRSIADLVMRREGTTEDQVRVIHNGVEVPDPPDPGEVARTRDELGFAPDDLVVGMVANYERPVKGVHQLLRAIPPVLAEEPRARFLVVGRGPRSFERLAAEMGLGDRVVFAGPQEEVDRFYGLMDVSVLSSLSEGLSLVLLESMAHGLPVVATDVGGNPEVVDEGITGYLVPPDEPRPFADGVLRLLKDETLRLGMGEAGLGRVRRNFSIDAVAESYEEMYGDLVHPGGAT